ncbi:chymotrypsin-2 [Plutella xylostella]|uniref:chymotrypsin-2 n=1 Tax=Plutella xylostella TaxID=51655 RepID=UPI00203313E1|nr:chymotrypsin-2 [Plutella xylostella]
MNYAVKSLFLINLSILAYGSYAYGLAIPVNTVSNVNRLFRSTRIHGGVTAPEGSAPYLLALVIGVNIGQMVCGGSIISSRGVLTAAHCIDVFKTIHGLTSSLRGVAGSNQWASTENNIRFKSHINHPDWDRNLIKNDIGVLITESHIVETHLIRFIALSSEYIPGGVTTSLAGWGNVNGTREEDGVMTLNPTPHNLQQLFPTTLDPRECSKQMKAAAHKLGWVVPHVDPAVEICTLHSVGHGACNGDSGSPLVASQLQLGVASAVQVGVVSWGVPCGRGAPDVYVRVSAFLHWVRDILRQWK